MLINLKWKHGKNKINVPYKFKSFTSLTEEMATATGSSGSLPPLPPPNFWKLSGMKKVDVNLDPTKPLIGIAENSDLG